MADIASTSEWEAGVTRLTEAMLNSPNQAITDGAVLMLMEAAQIYFVSRMGPRDTWNLFMRAADLIQERANFGLEKPFA